MGGYIDDSPIESYVGESDDPGDDGGGDFDGYFDEPPRSRGLRDVPHSQEPAPGMDLVAEGIGMDHPAFRDLMALLATMPGRGVVVQDGPWFDWDAFFQDIWDRKWEILLDIALTVMPVGKIFKIIKVFTKGRCFFVIACFVAGTDVWTPDGLRDIETIQPGELVLAYDGEAGGWAPTEVLATSETDYVGEMATITIEYQTGVPGVMSRETIECTAGHAFWIAAGRDLDLRPVAAEADEPVPSPRPTPGGKWLEARWLRIGDHFLTRTGRSAIVVGQVIRLERVPVYNLTLLRLHNYAVGQDGVVVHNKCHNPVIRGIYIFSVAGKPGTFYVGQSLDVIVRLSRHGNIVGKIQNIIPVSGGTLQRLIAEQKMINWLRKKGYKLKNERNPLAPWKWPSNGIPPP